jgi:hypothetical protein
MPIPSTISRYPRCSDSHVGALNSVVPGVSDIKQPGGPTQEVRSERQRTILENGRVGLGSGLVWELNLPPGPVDIELPPERPVCPGTRVAL